MGVTMSEVLRAGVEIDDERIYRLAGDQTRLKIVDYLNIDVKSKIWLV